MLDEEDKRRAFGDDDARFFRRDEPRTTFDFDVKRSDSAPLAASRPRADSCPDVANMAAAPPPDDDVEGPRGLAPRDRELLELHRGRAAGLRSPRLCLSLPVTLRLRADCDAHRLRSSVERLVQRHPGLRTAFTDAGRRPLTLRGHSGKGPQRAASDDSAADGPETLARSTLFKRVDASGWTADAVRRAALEALDDATLDPERGVVFRAALLDAGVRRRVVGQPARGRPPEGDDSDGEAPVEPARFDEKTSFARGEKKTRGAFEVARPLSFRGDERRGGAAASPWKESAETRSRPRPVDVSATFAGAAAAPSWRSSRTASRRTRASS